MVIIVGSIANQEYLNIKVYKQLASKLKTLGLEMTIPEMSGNGSVNLEVTQFGGRNMVKILMFRY